MSFYKLVSLIEDVVCLLGNRALLIKEDCARLLGLRKHLRKNVELKNRHLGERGFLVANGPSVATQDLAPLENEVTFFVNFGFKHPDYRKIKPTYHIIVDEKLINGVWDIKILEEIYSLNPSVIFLLNAKWANSEVLFPYLNNPAYRIYLVDMRLYFTRFGSVKKIRMDRLTYGAAVTGVAKFGQIYMGFKEFYFLGKDGNGLCYELIKADTHFYGANAEDSEKSPAQIHQSLWTMALSTKHWISFAKDCKRHNIQIINVTNGGIFDMFKRGKFEDLFK